MAKEYQLFNLEELEAHLSGCPACREELDGLREVDRSLSRLPRDFAPPDLAAGILKAVQNNPPEPVRAEKRWNFGRFAYIRDLIAAAAVTLVLFWGSGNLWDSQNVNLAGSKLNFAVQTYVSYSGAAVARAYDRVGSFSEQLLEKEWSQHEMRPSR